MIGSTASSEMIVAVCSLLGLFLVVLVVLMRRKVSPSTVDVDDFHIEKQSKNNSTKKIKQKKVSYRDNIVVVVAVIVVIVVVVADINTQFH